MAEALRNLVQGLDRRYERNRTPVFDAIIDGVTRNAARQITQATATIQGQRGTPVQVSVNLVSLAQGQMFSAENLGTAASPVWSLRGGAAGGNLYLPRVIEFGEDIGAYGGGDLLLGSDEALMANFFFDESAGAFYGRVGTTETLGLLALEGAVFVGERVRTHVYVTHDNLRILNGTEVRSVFGNLKDTYDYTQDVFGSAHGPYLPGQTWLGLDTINGIRIMHHKTRAFQVTPEGVASLGYAGLSEIQINPADGSLSFLVGGVVQSVIDSQARSILGFERLGLPLGPAIEWGPIVDPSGDPALERMGFNVRDASERFIGFWSGNSVNPTDAGMRVGAEGAAHFFQFSGGKISWAGANASLSEDGLFTASNAVLAGTITANTGTIGGWTINATTLAAGHVTLNSDGYLSLGTGNNVVKLYAAGTWRITAGHATLSSAPFRVAQDGSMYAERVHIAAGNTTINNDGIFILPGLGSSNQINWLSETGAPAYIKVTDDPTHIEMNMLVYAGTGLTLDSDVLSICTDPLQTLSFFGAAGSGQRSYIASPSATQVRDILIAFGFMAAS
jgi:hypothetical protein